MEPYPTKGKIQKQLEQEFEDAFNEAFEKATDKIENEIKKNRNAFDQEMEERMIKMMKEANEKDKIDKEEESNK